MRKWGEINTERENVTQLGRVSNAMQRNLMPWSSEWELHSSGVHLVTVTRKQSTLSIKRTVIFSQKLEHIFFGEAVQVHRDLTIAYFYAPLYLS